MRKLLRTLRRCFWVLAISAVGFGHFAVLRLRRRVMPAEQARWLQRYCRLLLPHLGVTCEMEGTVPAAGLIVANHVSYLDILALSGAAGCSFVSKAEVRSWPLFGWWARLAGTIFVWRQSAAHSAGACAALRGRLESGRLVTVFPEATTSDGEILLPFRPTMFQAAIDAGVPVTPAALSYSLEDGSVRDEICFWGDMRPIPHAMNLFSKRAIGCRIAFGDPLSMYDNRKRLAREAHEWVRTAAGQKKSSATAAELLETNH